MEFSSLGAHCSVASCNLRDFLPFTCSGCNKTFCLSHYKVDSHSCPNPPLQDSRVFTCPLCLQTLRVLPGEDLNLTWENHAASNCQPGDYKKKKEKRKKNRCAKKGCKVQLNVTNCVVCKLCQGKFCLKHRHTDDHNCLRRSNAAGNAAIKRNAAVNAAIKRHATGNAAIKRNAAANAALKRNTKGSQKVGKTSKRQKSLNMKTGTFNSGSNNNSNSNSKSNSSGRRREVCPICQARFNTVEELVTHSITFHDDKKKTFAPPLRPPRKDAPSSSSSSSSARMREVCPICQARFNTVEELVTHSITFHNDKTETAFPPRPPATNSRRECCPFCDAAFPSAVELVAHVEQFHANEGDGEKKKCRIA